MGQGLHLRRRYLWPRDSCRTPASTSWTLASTGTKDPPTMRNSRIARITVSCLVTVAVAGTIAWIAGPAPASARPTVIRIDAGGGTTYRDVAGNSWTKDSGFSGGNFYSKAVP